jgi:protocatechuate 3,4-dioxygenase beta subunit
MKKISLFPLLCALALVAPVAAQRGQNLPTPPPLDDAQGGGFPEQGPGGLRGFGVPRDLQNPAPKGTAKISGRVISAETGNPLRRAQVRLTAGEARTNRVTSTDNEGRYEFADLPASRYNLTVSKAGYVSLQYGQARAFEPGKPLELADRGVLEKIDFSLPRGSVIAGRVSDEYGEPIADATVQAMRYQFVNGQRQLVNIGRNANTDDIGQFRIFGLSPGDYIVKASVRNAPQQMMMSDIDDPSGYPPTYYPGTNDVGQAQTVNLGLGQEFGSVYFSLVPSRMARISGTVTDSQGKPLPGAIVVVRPAAGGGGMGALNIGGGNQVRADGTFALANVPPGEYTLDVQQRPRDGGGLRALAVTELEFASVPLTVTGEDISGMSIVTTTGSSVTGRVVFQGKTPPANGGQGLQVSASAPMGAPSLQGIARGVLGGGRVADDGTFELRGLIGLQMIRVNPPNGWTLNSVTLNDEEITDMPYDFKGGRKLTGLIVTLSDRLTDLAGSVKNRRGEAVKDYVLVVFPTDEKLWAGQSRFIRTARPDQDGRFLIRGLPPARYLAAVVESLETGSQNDPAVLEQLRPRGKGFSLADGESLTLDLEMP